MSFENFTTCHRLSFVTTIDDHYYDKNVKMILIYKRAIRGTFTRTERWEPASVKRSEVTKVKNEVWIREKITT